MKRILINAIQREEVRVAVVDGDTLYDLDIETISREQKKGNIYKARVSRVEPSLDAVFVDYGAERHGFLPIKEIARGLYANDVETHNGRLAAHHIAREGQEFLVQVDKEQRGTKGASLTTFISLPGRYLVLMPNNPRAGGISRRVEGDEREELRTNLKELEVPEGMGLIVRTAGVGRNTDELRWDLDYLLNLWQAIEDASRTGTAPCLIYQESSLIIRALRDYFTKDVNEILIDDETTYQQALEFVGHVMPHNLERIKRYIDPVPLFGRFHLETQIQRAFERELHLPSGGAVVIDHTEALTAIDVNSARATKGSDIEQTAYQTNLEAADEVARQLRLRDLGGLIVIDFIDMSQSQHQRAVEKRLRDAVQDDRARIQVGHMSRFGLLEMSRQRLRTSLLEHSQVVCPRCGGQGRVRGLESFAISMLRLMHEQVALHRGCQLVLRLPVATATYLLNEHRQGMAMLEQLHESQVIVIPDVGLDTPSYQLKVNTDRITTTSSQDLLHPAAERGESLMLEEQLTRSHAPQKPVVFAGRRPNPPEQPLPTQTIPQEPQRQTGEGILSRIWHRLFSETPQDTTPISTAGQGLASAGRFEQQESFEEYAALESPALTTEASAGDAASGDTEAGNEARRRSRNNRRRRTRSRSRRPNRTEPTEQTDDADGMDQESGTTDAMAQNMPHEKADNGADYSQEPTQASPPAQEASNPEPSKQDTAHAIDAADDHLNR
jgi:ribonuclease E